MPFDPAQGIPSEVEGCRPEGRVKKSLTRGPAFSRIGRNPPPKKLLVGRAKLVRPRVSDVVRRDCIAWAAKAGHYRCFSKCVARVFGSVRLQPDRAAVVHSRFTVPGCEPWPWSLSWSRWLDGSRGA